MSECPKTNPEKFYFRNLHPQVFLGTASDRYAGWLGQIYSEEHYRGRITTRTKIIAGKSFIEEVLPVDSVEEYFEHFPVLEIDFTFYRPLLENDGRPTQNYQVLKKYSQHLREDDHLLLKVPQLVTAHKIPRGGRYIENEAYLDTQIFTEQFYKPAVNLLGNNLAGFIFEQEYQRQEDRIPVNVMANDLDKFFRTIPKDGRYHLELRTELYLRGQVFEVLSKYGIGQVLSHWTWLPPLKKQLAKADERFFNSGSQSVIRLMTPLGMRYEDAYAKAYPFDRMVEGMLQPEMVLDAVEIVKSAIEKGLRINLIINNRAGGNAPMIAHIIAEKLMPKSPPTSDGQMSFW
jgi:uncharacterized protein YecE (DUF72 family)